MPLSSFSPRVREWFERAFAAPTPAQAQAWPAIAAGEHVLVSAPTGSGKTLAAFLWALDRLSADSPPGDGHGAASPATRVVYVSPLKALAYDIERNLRVPLRGLGMDERVRVGIRTGDTPQRERAAMARHPPDILITTPESLYLILTSQARAMLSGVEAVIVDEIHAVAHSKRGSHLALTLERLEAQAQAGRAARGQDARAVQRIGLSATQSPLEEIGRYLVGLHRRVRIVDAGARTLTGTGKQLDLRIEVPVESMAEPGQSPGAGERDPLEPVGSPGAGERDPLEPVGSPGAGEHDPLEPGRAPRAEPVVGESTRGSPVPERGIWPAIYPELLSLVRAHSSTIVFVNNRRSAERVALRLNELAAREAYGGENGQESGRHGAQGGGVGAPRSGGRGGQDKQIDDAASGGAGVRAETPGQSARELARAHHGSLAREERTTVEELLKAGEIPCLVATSSLELGIDMGAVDLVVQIESPKSVARGLQRIGRAGHGVEQVSRGRIFPKFRGDLLECAVVVRRMHEGLIESTVVPRNPLDVLAQQIVAIAVSAEPAAAGPSKTLPPAGDSDGEESPATGVSVDELYALVTSTYSYSELSRELLENVLDMLDGRYPSAEFGDLRARIVWDRLAGTIRARKGARQLAVANAGTIPDRGLYAVVLPDGRRVGELDEEMVYEARPGQAFLLGASAWRIEEIGRDRVIVTPAPGAPGAVPFWKGDSVGRPRELGAAIGAFSRWAVDQDAATLERDYDLDERAARNLLAYLREQLAATRVLPSDRTIVVERFRDEIGDWRLCVLSPYGGRVHAAWALALAARFRERFGLASDPIWTDDGIVLHLPDLDAQAAEELPSAAELVLIEPEEVEAAVTAELGSSALFAARFRENASRALLIPRAYPGRRTPLWQQRLKAQNLLEVARRYDDFPIVLETYRECLRDVLDVPGLRELLRALSTREIALVEVETPTASPFASSLLFDFLATYMYEGDTPSAERKAAALSLDRDLLRELLGQEELRELIDPGALARVEDDLQRRSDMTRARSRDDLHDVLRRVGDLTLAEVAERVFAGVDPGALLAELERERRAVRVRVAGEERFIAADEAGLYRDALGAVPPGGLPEAFLGDVPDALRVLVARFARTRGPFSTEELRARYGVDAAAVLRELERAGALVRGELRPNPIPPPSSPPPQVVGPASASPLDPHSPSSRKTGSASPADGREWCDVRVLRRLRRASLAALRKEIEPADSSRLAAFLPSWQGVDRHGVGGTGSSGIDRLREVLVPLQGLALPAEIWERDVLPRRTGAYSPSWLDSLCASGEIVWVGAGPVGRSGRVALYFREDAPAIGPPAAGASARAGAPPPNGSEHELLRARLSLGPCFFGDLLELDASAEVLREALWDLVWAGEVTNDAWAPLRASQSPARAAGRPPRGEGLLGAVAPLSRSRSRHPPPGRSRFGARAARAAQSQSQVQGRWSLTAPVFAGPFAAAAGADANTGAVSSSSSSSSSSTTTGVAGPERRRALAELLLERYGIVTREQVLAEGIKGGFALLYEAFSNLETLGLCRRGYFLEGMGGAQFALPGAVERLRAAGSVVGAAAAPGAPAGAGAPGGSTGAVGAVVAGTMAAADGPLRARAPTREEVGRVRRTLVLAAADPAQPYGAALPWPKREQLKARRPARVAGAYVVTVAEQPALYVERGGRGLLTFVDDPLQAGSGPTPGEPPAALREALRALAEAVRAGRVPKLALERIDGDPAIGSSLERELVELGFHSGPRRLTLSA